MNVKPSGYHILIELETVEEKTESGIIMHSKSEYEREQRGAHRGKVIAFGPLSFTGYKGVDDSLPVLERAEAWGVKVGDTIECGRYAGEMLKKEGVDRFMLIPDSKVLGVINE